MGIMDWMKGAATGGATAVLGGGDKRPARVAATMGAKKLTQRIEKRQAAGKPTGFAEKQLSSRIGQTNKAAGAKVGQLNQRIENRLGAGKNVAGLQERRAGIMGRVQGRVTTRGGGGRAFRRGLTSR